MECNLPSLLHHIAISTSNLLPMVEFYSKLPGLNFLEWKLDEDGNKRSGWFSIQPSLILMIEASGTPKGPEAILFTSDCLSEAMIPDLPPILSKTKSSIYFQDPDGNKLGYSAYPHLFPFQVSLSE